MQDAPAIENTRRLLDLPFVFSQTRLLTPSDIAREATARGVFLVDFQLEALHETRIVQPIYRVSYDVRAAVRAARRDPDWRWEILRHTQRDVTSLLRSRRAGRLFDPARASFVPWDRYERRFEDVRFRASDFLYSPFQLVALPFVRDMIPRLERRTRRGRWRWVLDSAADWEGERAELLRCVAVVASALEAYYRPLITGRLRLPVRGAGGDDFDEYDRWVDTFDAPVLLDWLGITGRNRNRPRRFRRLAS